MATRDAREAVKGPSPWKIARPARWMVYSVALLGFSTDPDISLGAPEAARRETCRPAAA